MNELTCVECRTKSVRPVTGRYSDDIKHDGRAYHIDIPDLRLLRCEQCGGSVIPDEADERIGMELRRVANLLAPHQIKAIRDKFNLTQKELAELLGIGEATVCRWEKGTQVQQRAFDKLLRAYEAVPGLRAHLNAERARATSTIHPSMHPSPANEPVRSV